MDRRRLFVGLLVVATAVMATAAVLLVVTDGGNGNDGSEVTPGGDAAAVLEAPSLGTNADVEGAALPAVSLADVDGGEVDVTSFAGGPLVLNFWNVDCAPCKREMPVLAETSAALAGEVRFVGVNTADTAERAGDFAATYGADYVQLLDPDGELVTAVGVGLLPTTLFVDAGGRIVLQRAGELTRPELDAAIAEAFGPMG